MHRPLCLGIVIGAVACATASGDVSGGDPRPPDPSAVVDAGSDAPTSFPEESIDAGSGSTWPDLYRDLFGPTGIASCAGTGACHGAADQAGALGSSGAQGLSGYICADLNGCVTTMKTMGLVRASDATQPQTSVLYTTIRHRAVNGAIIGFMPKEPATVVFPRSAMDRVAAWIAAGAPPN